MPRNKSMGQLQPCNEAVVSLTFIGVAAFCHRISRNDQPRVYLLAQIDALESRG
jgi:hypothetical protein